MAPAGGLGNTRQDLDAAYGPPAGETPGKLVVYRKDNTEYRVEFTPEPPRDMLLVKVLPQNAPIALDAAIQESRRFFPKDTQPRASGPEGNDQFVVERFLSPTLAQALPAQVFEQRKGQPGEFLAVYTRNQQGQITRVIVGVGNDPSALIQRAGQ